jgi:uncharacterized membrane protein
MTTPDNKADELKLVTDWAEQRGMENLREHLVSMDDLKKDANTTLTIFMAAAGASIAYAINNAHDHSLLSLVAGASGMGTFFLVLSATLLHTCLRIGDAPTVANSPENLFQAEHTLQAIKAEELKNIVKRKNQAIERNQRTTKWLNRLRYAALCGPVLFLLIYGYFSHCRSS